MIQILCNKASRIISNVYLYFLPQVVLNSLENLLNQPLVMSKTKPLIGVSLKLLGYCAKITSGRDALLAPSLSAIQSLLPVLRLCLEYDLTSIQGSSGVVHLTDQILEVSRQLILNNTQCMIPK